MFDQFANDALNANTDLPTALSLYALLTGRLSGGRELARGKTRPTARV
jgi:hypothetical protein